MAGEGVDIEMDDFDEGWTDPEGDTNETSFTDINQRFIPLDTNPHIITVGSTDTNRVRERINTSDDDRKQDKSLINARKKFFREELGMTVNKGDGEASKELLEQSTVSRNKKSGKVDGIFFRGVKVMIREKGKEGKIIRNRNTSDKRIIKVTNEYEDLLEKADNEHFNRLERVAEETSNGPTTLEAMDDIISRAGSAISDWVEERVENLQEEARGIHIPEQVVRELSGTLHPVGTDEEQIVFLERQADYFRLEALKEVDPVKEQFYRSVRETAELKADSIRIRIGERPEHTEAVSILENEVENNDLNRLERFKRWAKKNMVGLSAIAITIAGIITTIVVAARGAVSGGARAVGGFAKALASLGKSLGPLLAPLFSLVAQALTWGAKGIAWLANNLWVLAIAMTWLLYDYWKNSKNRK